ncbi:ORF16 [Betabaculovirus altermyunipunctae]|uniref:ORF16 n=1 Tax=Betabaculovirus altermyunipunctae TaxID=3051996 RepID=A0A1S5YDW2_9BBAC|nr:ORF16 [Betabaculovirus altermyunipunctae]AQQ80283.1 ORF16 [Betabaculovirus altermyunipunctae]
MDANFNKFNSSYHQMPVTAQLDRINNIKRQIVRVTTHHERLARIEKHPQATENKLRVLRETFLLTITDML